jgi:uncharacterized membrane protein YebE (DUF533 family)
MNPKNVLEQFLGAGTLQTLQKNLPQNLQNLKESGGLAKQKLDSMGGGGFTGGAVAGGLLGLLLGSKKMRKVTGSLFSYGMAAGAGALAYQAYKNWQQGVAVSAAPAPTQDDIAHIDKDFLPENAPAADGQPFELVMVKAMIGAAKADGHIDATEQQKIFDHVEKLGMDAETKAFVFDALSQPADIAAIAAGARNAAQASEIYLVSRLAIDPDHAAERAWLQALAHKLKLPSELIAHLDHQVEVTLKAQN